jgi:hypothetical protein
MGEGRYRHPMTRTAALGLLLLPGACGRPGDQAAVTGNGLSEAASRTESNTSAATTPPVQPTVLNGLAPADVQGIAEAVRADLLRRQFSWQGPMSGDQQPCTNVFDVGQPQIVDASLSGQTGRVRTTVPITGQRPYRAPEHFNIQWWYPTQYCYGVVDDGRWVIGRTVNVLIEYNVEHWQSGWRLSANQAQG